MKIQLARSDDKDARANAVVVCLQKPVQLPSPYVLLRTTTDETKMDTDDTCSRTTPSLPFDSLCGHVRTITVTANAQPRALLSHDFWATLEVLDPGLSFSGEIIAPNTGKTETADTVDVCLRNSTGRILAATEQHLALLYSSLRAFLLHRPLMGTTRIVIPDILDLTPRGCLFADVSCPSAPADTIRLITGATECRAQTNFRSTVPNLGDFVARVQEDVPGMPTLVASAVKWLRTTLVSGCSSHALVVGSPGSGKTHLVARLAHRANVPCLTHTYTGDLSTLARHLTHPAATPQIVIIEQLDLLDTAHAELLAHLLDQATGTTVLAVTDRPHVVPVSLLRSRRLEHTIRLVAPTADGRRAMLARLLAPMQADDGVVDTLTARTHGFFPSDLRRMVTVAATRAISFGTALDDELVAAASEVQPAALLEHQTKIPSVSFTDVYGLDDVIDEIRSNVIDPMTQPNSALAQLGLARGIIFHGPTGTGKSMLAYALVRELSVNCVSIDASQILSKVVGESERTIAKVFQSARAAAPCILLIDQLETLCGARGVGPGTTEGTTDRVVTCFLTELDGILAAPTTPDNYIFVVAMTNHISDIDSALLRPGRLELHVLVDVPRAAQRRAIVRGYARRHPCKLSDDELEVLVNRFDGMTGAEIQNQFQEAAVRAIREDAVSISLNHFA
ncbi:hypothetical protein AMAG_06989 [Allomyces macrogynus ATCC 38327]|uniref:AAA+ ATPase domain-containing protein n=1 Tax=Allomyces macrogynus (strain ATCC 38327) TaxID=578462 RepID=A0A0L0SFG4_ALLM3|nr:hypothetical protein AMAG_06989 [Allomyces macrogynus ATCC 38327]|eukprot:KNE61241.1 hypothetical protein AMAG_06989 [Allomyces macrogynus ATCC 38327]